MNRLVILDGNALIHRAFHAIPPLNTPAGEPINAVFGFTTMLLKVIDELKPTFLVATFDNPTPTFRHTLYPLYKSHRPPVKVEMEPQFSKVKKIVESLAIPIFEVPGFEADDLIGTLARQGESNPKVDDILIVTGDMDTLQLIDKKTRIFTSRKGMTDTFIYDEAAVIDRFGIKPHQIIDYKALRGDTSDEIPGVPGIGEKTAATLLQEYVTLEGIYQNLPAIKEKTRVLLESNFESAQLSRKLATIDVDAPVLLDLALATLKRWQTPSVMSLFQQYGFRSLIKRYFVDQEEADSLFAAAEPIPTESWKDSSTKSDGDYILIENREHLEEVLSADFTEMAFDTETTSLDVQEAELVGFSFSYKEGSGYYAPYKEEYMPVIKKVLENPKILKIGHNIKYDMGIMLNYGVRISSPYYDTMLAVYINNPGVRGINLKNLAFTEFGIMMTEISELIGTGKKQVNMKDVPVEQVAPYASADADITLRLKKSIEQKLHQTGVEKIFHEIEIPLVQVLLDMETAGVLLDTQFLSKMSSDLGEELADLEKNIYESVGHEFNINSTKQLADVLFSELKLPATVKTKTGYSTDESVLQSLKGAHPIAEYLLRYRELFKLKSTYVDALPNLISSKDKRIHTTFNQTIAATGRLSSTDPNLQNIPVGDGMGGQIRKAFVAEGDKTLMSADYSQIELRIMAHYTQDPKLVEAFETGQDIHASVAAQVFNVPIDQVSRDQRRFAKTVNFGLMYGQSAFGLAQQLGIGRNEAAMFINNYFKEFSKVREFLEEIKRQARDEGCVTTLLGRKRFTPDMKSSIPAVRAGAERAAINHPFQGTAADIIKLAMLAIAQRFEKEKIQDTMILQVHDELVFEVAPERVKPLASLVKEEMEKAMKLRVPLSVDVKSGQNWGEMSKLELKA